VASETLVATAEEKEVSKAPIGAEKKKEASAAPIGAEKKDSSAPPAKNASLFPAPAPASAQTSATAQTQEALYHEAIAGLPNLSYGELQKGAKPKGVPANGAKKKCLPL